MWGPPAFSSRPTQYTHSHRDDIMLSCDVTSTCAKARESCMALPYGFHWKVCFLANFRAQLLISWFQGLKFVKNFIHNIFNFLIQYFYSYIYFLLTECVNLLRQWLISSSYRRCEKRNFAPEKCEWRVSQRVEFRDNFETVNLRKLYLSQSK